MDRDQALEQVLAFLAETMNLDAAQLEPGATLNESMVLDSLALIEMITFLEREFGLSLTPEDLASLDTPGRIADLIVAKRAGDDELSGP